MSLDKIVGVYKRSKYLAEQAVLDLVREHAVPVVIVNPSTPVGPRDVKPTPTGKMIRDAATGRMPAFVETGLNIVHVDDVAEGHVLALKRGVVGERYILGGEDFALGDLFALVAKVAGRKPPRIKLPIGPLVPVALACELLARFGVEPVVTRETLAMARKTMFYSSAKAQAALGYARVRLSALSRMLSPGSRLTLDDLAERPVAGGLGLFAAGSWAILAGGADADGGCTARVSAGDDRGACARRGGDDRALPPVAAGSGLWRGVPGDPGG